MPWEYMTIGVAQNAPPDGVDSVAGVAVQHESGTEEVLNALSADGWELVAVDPNPHAPGHNPVLYLKRVRPVDRRRPSPRQNRP